MESKPSTSRERREEKKKRETLILIFCLNEGKKPTSNTSDITEDVWLTAGHWGACNVSIVCDVTELWNYFPRWDYQEPELFISYLFKIKKWLRDLRFGDKMVRTKIKTEINDHAVHAWPLMCVHWGLRSSQTLHMGEQAAPDARYVNGLPINQDALTCWSFHNCCDN